VGGHQRLLQALMYSTFLDRRGSFKTRRHLCALARHLRLVLMACCEAWLDALEEILDDLLERLWYEAEVELRHFRVEARWW
jgi:hypothetical protein